MAKKKSTGRTPEEYAKIFPDADPLLDFVGDEGDVINSVAERTLKTPEEVRQILMEEGS